MTKQTNEEKAREIAEKNYQQEKNGASSYTIAVVSAIEVADWKDHQFKEYLERKRDNIIEANRLSARSQFRIIDEIIKELFGED